MNDNPATDRLMNDINDAPTRIVLRRFRDDPKGIIALLIDEPGTREAYTCMMYEHVGQHGHGHPDAVVANSTPVRKLDCPTAKDARALLNELRSMGYNPRVLQRIPSDALQRRRETLAAIRSR